MHIYLAHIPDSKYPYSTNGERCPILLPYVISLGILIYHKAALLPNREWYQPTLGM